MTKILLIGSGAREHAIFKALQRSGENPQINVFGSTVNPGLSAQAAAYRSGPMTDPDAVLHFAQETHSEIAIIGPEAPLESGVADALVEAGIPTVGPQKELAKIESSKGFARDLLLKHGIPGSPAYQRFSSLAGVEAFLTELGGNFVVKADGLMGGKGVKVSGEHLENEKEALSWCREIVDSGSEFVIEEKCVGPEFSMFTFTDGKTFVHSPLVQDHKRAYVGDEGPNTGGMGSYSMADHRLPFVEESDVQAAVEMNEKTLAALATETGSPYRGILYGGFMATADGIRLIEYNARFGDPECMNLLTLFEGNFLEAVKGMATGTLDPSTIGFRKVASVCKYLVPEGYPDKPKKLFPIDLSEVPDCKDLYLGSVDEVDGQLLAAGSRTLAFVGTGSTLAEAEAAAEALANKVPGPLFHRPDIGTEALVQKRIDLIQSLRG
ncbi:phosphoribosylamine--glycine ligase [Puniceicoccus vermicola]|uniref:Phosphoribosylamine--glycine ligase n=1 Tax=Puniceicoccus vermicola TaxID=388746 RepID=A0A7X1E5Y3_9BACT|nr:phosphoribosylamine--glycine ligase [Puniceicoccus vermicola]MBC2603621.1 phosphoribosylamine--glycine ligase [Puniceicoccus vermicola]